MGISQRSWPSLLMPSLNNLANRQAWLFRWISYTGHIRFWQSLPTLTFLLISTGRNCCCIPEKPPEAVRSSVVWSKPYLLWCPIQRLHYETRPSPLVYILAVIRIFADMYTTTGPSTSQHIYRQLFLFLPIYISGCSIVDNRSLSFQHVPDEDCL